GIAAPCLRCPLPQAGALGQSSGDDRPSGRQLPRVQHVVGASLLLVVDPEPVPCLADRTDGLNSLHYLRYTPLEPLIIHGDATVDNLIVAGAPPRLVGLIDFAVAYHEAWLVDLAAGLWRSGRATPAATTLAPGRVIDFVRGYHRRHPLTVSHLRAIP